MLFRRFRQVILLKCDPQVQRDNFSKLDQSYLCLLALWLPLASALLKLLTVLQRNEFYFFTFTVKLSIFK